MAPDSNTQGHQIHQNEMRIYSALPLATCSLADAPVHPRTDVVKRHAHTQHDALHTPPHPHPPAGHGRPAGASALRHLKPVHGGTLKEQLGFSVCERGAASTGAARVWQHLGQTLRAVEGALRPTGVTSNDHTRAERIINIVTSLPFLAAGAHIMKYVDVIISNAPSSSSSFTVTLPGNNALVKGAHSVRAWWWWGVLPLHITHPLARLERGCARPTTGASAGQRHVCYERSTPSHVLSR